MKEKSVDINYIDYFTALEKKRFYENLQRNKTRKFKQEQLWFATEDERENLPKENSFESNSQQLTTNDLPSINEIINQDSIETIKILNGNSNFLPNGFYERLLICLHPLFYERLDYYNITIGKTMEKNLIQIERFDTQNYISITTNNCLLETIQNILIHHLFLFYPTVNLRIET